MLEKNDQNIIEEEKIILEKNKKLMKKYLVFFFVIILVIGSFSWGFHRGKNSFAIDNSKKVPLQESIVENRFPVANHSVDFSLFWRVWELVKEKHIEKDKLDAQKMVYGAINGMLQATGDPYSSFFNPQETLDFSRDLEGVFEGIGAELGIKDQILTVIAPLEDSPAQKSGLIAGDKILKINEKISTDLTIDEAVEMIRGKKGTSVTLTILHSGEEETAEVVIVREKIEIKSVKLNYLEDNIAHIKIIKFGDNTSREFNNALNDIINHNAKGIIVDVRNNPGGLLDKSVEVASKMIPKGKVVVIEEQSNGKKESLTTLGGDKLSSLPTVMLINQGSASASEILAGALRDNQGITLIGEKSFGKGSVQELISLIDGSSVKITVAKWLTPKGEYIMEKGISPDIEVPLTVDDYKNNRDPQLDKAKEVLKEKISR